ncbi:MAG: NADH-quinone oxidoreductase subunit J [Betaproteobacteria bacterium]|nr:NADH-quinone oxidoreductase subunit J [Betaproteobacteria bacterium]
MDFETFVFYSFGAILVASGLRVVTARNPVHAALALVLAFFTAAGLWILLEAEFLAITLVLVYVGAVMVLFLFVVMMLDLNLTKLREGFWSYLPVAVTVAALMGFEMTTVLYGRSFGSQGATEPAGYSNTKALGSLLYTQYLYPFEVAAVILLVAIVAAIALTMRHRKDTKYQNPAAQVSVKRQDRVRMVKMKATPRAETLESQE